MEKFYKKGDVVRLKSGGPNMTVLEYKTGHDILAVAYGRQAKPSWETEYVYCQWFEKTKLKGHDFHQDLLELAN
jgi:uncharacterized protein YodC (DUF2158 family)